MSSHFPPAVRLRDSDSYNQVFQAPEHRSSDRYFTVLGRFSVVGARLGIVVAKRNVKRAHERNRIKRLARETFRTQREILPSVDVVIIAKAAAGTADNAAIFRSLSKHLSRITPNL